MIGNSKGESSTVLCLVACLRSGEWQSGGRVVEDPAAVIGNLEDESSTVLCFVAFLPPIAVIGNLKGESLTVLCLVAFLPQR